MALVGEERREFQRLHLESPIDAKLGEKPVSILEIGVLGARVRHQGPPGPQYSNLTFRHRGKDVVLKCELVRTIPDGTQSGLRFLAAVDESGDRLREMLGELIAREFDERRPGGAAHSLPGATVDGDKTVRGKDAAFLCYRLEGERWRKRRVFLPEQPTTGFTVARSEDSEEMQRLCQIYQASDDEGRRLIRLFAELSVSDALQIPPSM